MAYTWEPRWESYRIDCYGIVIYTCRDKVTRIIACPICINAFNKCLSGETIIDNRDSRNIFFYTEEDLIIHIREYHALRYLRKTISKEED